MVNSSQMSHTPPGPCLSFFITFFCIPLFTRITSAVCNGRASCPLGLECVQRTSCQPPLYTPPPELTNFHRISEIQGSGTVSPFDGRVVTTIGVITVIDSRSSSGSNIWIQDIYEDNDPRTSEALFLFRPNIAPSPIPAVGDVLQVSGNVSEYTPSTRPNDLPITQIGRGSAIVIVPDAAIVVQPRQFRPRPPLTSFGTGSGYDQEKDTPRTNIVDINYECESIRESAICYYEAHEHMLVEISTPYTKTAELRFGEIGILNCRRDDKRCTRSSAVTKENFLPSLITVQDALFAKANRDLGVGMKLAPFKAIVFYSFSQYKLYNLDPLTLLKATPRRKPVPCEALKTEAGILRIASWNVLNRDPKDPNSELQEIADNIANLQLCPDIIGLSEIGDNDGPNKSDITSANITLQQIASAAGFACDGAPYVSTDIAPENNADGGLPGENIRVAFLYRDDKVELASGVAKGGPGDTVRFDPKTDGLTLNPGRIEPDVFVGSRKPLAAEFKFVGSSKRSFIVIVNHWNSKFGDQALFGAVQPPVQQSQVERRDQSMAVKAFLDSIPKTKGLFVLGDFNDFHFSEPVTSLALKNLWFKTPKWNRYSFVFQSRFQTLDHILVGSRVRCLDFCPVHSSTLTAFGSLQRPSDHDPLVALCIVL